MTPTFTITASGTDISKQIREQFLELRLTDEAGISADELEMKLADRDAVIPWPQTGTKFTLSLGYKEDGLVHMGTFILDEVTYSDPPAVMTIRARAADLQASLKSKKERFWDNITIGDLVAQIANEHGLTANVAPEFAGTTLFHYDQNESDLHFLTRLAEARGAVATIKQSLFIFAPRGKATTATGQSMEPVAIQKSKGMSITLVQAGRVEHGSLKAKWYDPAAAEMMFETTGEQTPVRVLDHVYPDQTSAQAAAQAALRRAKQTGTTIDLSLVGNPRIMAETRLNLSGWRDEINGAWIAKTVTHTLTPSGFTTQVAAEAIAEP